MSAKLCVFWSKDTTVELQWLEHLRDHEISWRRGSSSQWGLIIASGKEAKRDIFSVFLNMKVCCVFSLESPHRGDSNEYTQHTTFKIKKENHPKLSQICNYGILLLWSQEQVQNSRGKRAISVRAIEILLYLYCQLHCLCSWVVYAFTLILLPIIIHWRFCWYYY